MMRVVVAAAALAVLGGCEDAGVNRVVDGERVVVDGHRLRLHQVDAPSAADAKCDVERAAGELVVERLQGEFLSAKALEFRKTGMACLQFMWCDAFVTADGRDVSDMLVAEGLAVRSSMTEAKLDAHDWCAAPLTPETPSPAEANVIEPAPGPAPNAESGLQSSPEDPQPPVQEAVPGVPAPDEAPE